jgi:hypothetical protein
VKREKVRKPLKRSRIKQRGPSKAETERVYGSNAFRAFLRLTPCLCCGVVRPIEQAHFGKHGTGKRNDWRSTGPLCGAFTIGAVTYPGCHARLDRREMPKGVEWFSVAERMILATLQRAFIEAWDISRTVIEQQRSPSGEVRHG